MKHNIIQWKRIYNDVKIPIKGSQKSAGYDIFSYEDIIIQPQSKYLTNTGFQIAIPNGYYGRIAPRCGMANSNFIDIGAGVIDSDYRGEIKIILFNFSNEEYVINKGDRIAQIIFQKNQNFKLQEVKFLQQTDRSDKGFGSTGYN